MLTFDTEIYWQCLKLPLSINTMMMDLFCAFEFQHHNTHNTLNYLEHNDVFSRTKFDRRRFSFKLPIEYKIDMTSHSYNLLTEFYIKV